MTRITTEDKFYDILCELSEKSSLTLEDYRPKVTKPKKQPCSEKFELTDTRRVDTSNPETREAEVLKLFLMLNTFLEMKARLFCKYLGDNDCKKPEFIRYSKFDWKETRDYLEVTLSAEWKCVKEAGSQEPI